VRGPERESKFLAIEFNTHEQLCFTTFLRFPENSNIVFKRILKFGQFVKIYQVLDADYFSSKSVEFQCQIVENVKGKRAAPQGAEVLERY
jgi:hypothetical protein